MIIYSIIVVDRSVMIKAYQSALIIDDNQKWNHPQNYTRISQYLDGDLHDFFDLVNDELLFTQINDQFEMIFIGEIFHVINLQTLIYNLELAVNCLTTDGQILIAVNANSIETAKTEARKIIGRLQLLEQYTVTDQEMYVDEVEWTMLTLQKRVDVINPEIEVQLQLGAGLADMANTGKSLSKIKSGLLKSKLAIDNQAFKASYTNNQQLLSLYFQNQIINLNPGFKREYYTNLADLIYSNRNSLQQLEDIELLKNGSFTLGLEHYQRSSIVQDQLYIAENAQLVNLIWDSIDQKPNKQLYQAINNIKE